MNGTSSNDPDDAGFGGIPGLVTPGSRVPFDGPIDAEPFRDSDGAGEPQPPSGPRQKRSKFWVVVVVVAAVAVGYLLYSNRDFIKSHLAGTKPDSTPTAPAQTAPKPKPAAGIACNQVDKTKVHDAVQTAAQAMVKSGTAPSAAIVVGCGSKAVTTVAVGAVNGKAPSISATSYDQASVTKLVVDTAIYRLVYEGKLKTSDPVGKYLPAWKTGPKAKVTVAMLMNHTSGLLGEGNTVESLLHEIKIGVGHLTDAEAIERQIINMPLTYKPGEYHYSNLGYVVLYHVGGVAAGQPEQFNRYMRDDLFKPLGMNDTVYRPDKKSRQCAPTHPYENPKVTLTCSSRDLLARKTGEVTGHAGLFSTASDMSQLARLLVNDGQFGGKRYLNAADVARMSKPQSATNAYGSAVWTNSKGRFGELSKAAIAGYGDTGATVSVDRGSKMWVVLMNNSSPTTDGMTSKIKKAVAAVNTAAIKAARGTS